MSKQGLRMVDLRHTLPNLKYLLTVLTTGKGELPVRKKGGVKGLMRVGSDTTVGSTRSAETEDGPEAGRGVKSGEEGKGGRKGVNGNGNVSGGVNLERVLFGDGKQQSFGPKHLKR